MVEIQDFSDIKSFDTARDETIEREKIGKVLEAGRQAPSPGNVHTVEFVVVESSSKREKLSKILGDVRARDAPTSIVVLTDPERMGRRTENALEACYAEASASAQNMRVMASSEGLCSNLVMGFDGEAVSNLLNVPDKKVPLAVVSLAYSDDPVSSSDRFGMNEICFYDEYENQITSVFDGLHWRGLEQEKAIQKRRFSGFRKKLRQLLER